MKTGFIGGGNMAEALIRGMTSRGMKDIIVSEPLKERRRHLQKTYNIETTEANRDIVSSCNIIILAVKPQNMDAVTGEIRGTLTDDKTVVSIAAGITTAYLTSRLGTGKIIRAMPNTPALVRKGMTVISPCEGVSGGDIAAVSDIFKSVGEVITLPEKYMNAVTALSGSGPAFIAYFIESMTEGGVKTGLGRDEALKLAVQTLAGTAGLLDTGMSPSKLREMVTSPGGTTEAGLRVFESRGLADTVADALQAARKRAEELGRGS
ncbi:MAG: pyrroline-5-carboxylate reductase [Deferribacteres bacterium]|nr:pyrroline-5-carboxylate reductase [Deferribacteres bacterium]